MPLFRVSGNEIEEYEQDIEADSAEEAEDIFIKNSMCEGRDTFLPVDVHSWHFHETKEITDEQ